jgi:OmpA-OmpF porin, OOP family
MSVNLLDLLKGQLGGDMLSKAATLLGEDHGSTQKAMSAVLPAILGGVANQGSTTSGAANLMNMLSNGGHDGSIFSNLSGLLGGGSATQGLIGAGGNIIKGLFGDRVGGIVDFIASHAGIKSSSATSMLGMAAPMVMGMLGKHTSENGTTANGLMDLLHGHTDIIKNALPAGLGNMMGLGHFDTSSVASKATAAVGTAAAAATSVASNVRNTASHSVREVEEEASAGFGKFLPWLLLLAGLLAALWFWKSCNSETPAAPVKETTAVVAPTATPVAAEKMDTCKCKDGETLVSKPGSFISNLCKEFSTPTPSVGYKVAFDNLNFATNSSVIAEDAKGQLNDLAKLLKAFPRIELEVGGHTDNVGEPAKNKTLSQARADAAKAFLIAAGIAKERMTSVGYGDVNPIVPNDSDANKAKNRCTMVTITKDPQDK